MKGEVKEAHYCSIHSCKALYLSLQAHATDKVRPVAQSANSKTISVFATPEIERVRTFDNWITFTQSARFGSFKECIFFPAGKRVHEESFGESGEVSGV